MEKATFVPMISPALRFHPWHQKVTNFLSNHHLSVVGHGIDLLALSGFGAAMCDGGLAASNWTMAQLRKRRSRKRLADSTSSR
jgi:hypothetical protein